MLWLLLLPLKLMIGLLLLPFILLRVVVKLLATLILLPIVLALAAVGVLIGGLGLMLGGLAFSFALLLPLLPFAIIALFVWAIVKVAAHPVAI
jgi:hypothetical protein